MKTTHSIWTAALVVGIGCSGDVAPPQLTAVEPPWGWNGESTDVVLRGADFFPSVVATGTSEFETDREFDVWLRGAGADFHMDGVTLQDLSTLRARVPEGLPVGQYDVAVRGPADGVAVLENGFSVTDSRADHLQLDASSLTHPVMSLARVGVAVVDRIDAPVPYPLTLTVRVAGDVDPNRLTFESTLVNQRWDGALPGIVGELGASGAGFVAFTAADPTEVWLEFSPEDPDSVIGGASQFIAFTAGDAAGIDVELPEEDFVVQAGDAFPLRLRLRDEAGNATDGSLGSVVVVERCGLAGTRFEQSVVFADEHVLLDAKLTTATGDASCPVNGFEVIGQAQGRALSAASRDVVVAPGSEAALDVEVWQTTVTAGVDSVVALVRAVDAWGNTVPDYAEPVVWTEEGNLLAPPAVECRPFESGVTTCEFFLTRATSATQLHGATSDGLVGLSEPIEVLPGPAIELEVDVADSTVAAGDLFDLTLQAFDGFGNTVAFDPTGSDLPEFTDGRGSVSCAWTASTGHSGEQRFACAATYAEPEKVLAVTLNTGAHGVSDVFEVTNNNVAVATIDLDGVTSLVAGDPLDVTVSTFDVWGNPYRLQSVSQVQLFDKSGSVVGEPVALDADGAGSVRLRPTTTWVANQIDAYDGTTRLGRSLAFDVTPGAAARLGVEFPRTWFEVGESVVVEVTAEDAYGNAVPSFSDSVSLTSVQNAGSAAVATGFVDGVAEAEFVWTQVALQDQLLADGGGLSGTSDLSDVVEDCGSTGPSASLLVGGSSELVLCRVGGTTPATLVDSSGSVAGAAPLLTFHYATESGVWARSTTDSTTHKWTEMGSTRAEVVVVDTNGCAASATADVWVGDNDGQPAGPLSLAVASGTLVAGSATLGVTQVDVSATDCAGDPASGGTLQVRASLGEVRSASTAVSPTGAGIEFALDGAGEASALWSMAGVSQDGEATISVGTATGSAFADADVEVTGEFDSPTVLSVSPAGELTDAIAGIEIVFSEALLPASLSSSSVAVVAPDGTPESGVSLLLIDDTLSLSFAQAIDPTLGVWTLSLDPSVRDTSGNRLDGSWTGAASAFQLEFGSVVDTAPDATTCSASVSVFRPDGDDGSGDEADAVWVAMTVPSTPAWWRLTVLDAAGETVLVSFVDGATAGAVVEWDGRDQNGGVVQNGVYEVGVDPLDAAWNEGAGCFVTTRVDNRVHGPEGSP